jgi:hypothetical protein
MFDPRRISLIEASTKSGKTVTASLAMAAEGQAGAIFWWVALNQRQARIAYNRMQASDKRRGRRCRVNG